MKRKVTGASFIMVLLLSAAGLTLVNLATANSIFYLFEPEQPPAGYRIYTDGNHDVPFLDRNGNKYTFTRNVEGTIVIERDGIVLEGAGYTLQGSGNSHGIWLQDRNGVTIKNLNIANFSVGIRFSHYIPSAFGECNPVYATNCTIEACTIADCNSHGIYLTAFNCSISGNHITHNNHGVSVSGSGNIFRNNKIEGCKEYSFRDTSYDNNVDSSNFVYGGPIYYWTNQHNKTVPENAGLVILKDCSSILVHNLNITGSFEGITLYNTNVSKIYGNSISHNFYGISVTKGYNNKIIGNQIVQNTKNGIRQSASENTTISNNLIAYNEGGIYDTDSKNSIISSNQITNNSWHGIQASTHSIIDYNYVYGNSGDGIQLYNIQDSIIINNNVTGNGGSGLGLNNGENGTVSSNFISKNGLGIWIWSASNNVFTSNNVVENSGFGIRIGTAAKNNLIYLNNFANNNNGSAQASVYPNYYDPNYSIKNRENITTFEGTKFLCPYTNWWDNGAEGNYWSDLAGNTTYYIATNNLYNHPLSAPLAFAALELSSIGVPIEEEGSLQSTSNVSLLIVCLGISVTAVAGVVSIVFFRKKGRWRSEAAKEE